MALTYQEIPLQQTNGIGFEMSVKLSSVVYWLRFHWNESWQFWTFDFLDPSKDPIELGIKLVMGVSLLQRVMDLRKPPGVLLLTDVDGDGSDPGPDDLGQRCRLSYITAAS
jgi:hypothetical protein